MLVPTEPLYVLEPESSLFALASDHTQFETWLRREHMGARPVGYSGDAHFGPVATWLNQTTMLEPWRIFVSVWPDEIRYREAGWAYEHAEGVETPRWIKLFNIVLWQNGAPRMRVSADEAILALKRVIE